jgi:glutathionylspermidine amidase/synthetase
MLDRLASKLYYWLDYLALSLFLYFAAMPKHTNKKVAPFDTVLGVTDGGCIAYSCDYETVDRTKFPTRESMQMTHNSVYTGYRYQCVELARRYLLINHGVVFESIPMAYDIFNLRTVKRVVDDELFAMTAHENGSTVKPVKGSMLIWKPMGEFKVTGHVAIIVDIQADHIDIVEQNVEDAIWPEGQKYSRRLKASFDAKTGKFNIPPDFFDSEVLGWMNYDFSGTITKEV